jgi:hypothetical protein
MKRFETTRETASRKFASRPVRAAVAIKIALAIIAANVSFAAAKAVFHDTTSPALIVLGTGASVTPFIIPVDEKAEAAPEASTRAIQVGSLSGCHEVVTRTDDGYGVSGAITRTVCRKAL